ncbi:hypothetical protein [Aporhodopirellula aestuarii]|uniref:Uncharacterized protein n=1 Tax=Aporhodopirellula aestuarii TaxID=2950107 RepID=A0ABT0U0D2_9BACT|nr:hypothetical protein [Aporhodopirellula aestuarii]MCM2370281.1 hypothetical protein [Aporhodopirellula aestuarii]
MRAELPLVVSQLCERSAEVLGADPRQVVCVAVKLINVAAVCHLGFRRGDYRVIRMRPSRRFACLGFRFGADVIAGRIGWRMDVVLFEWLISGA